MGEKTIIFLYPSFLTVGYGEANHEKFVLRLAVSGLRLPDDRRLKITLGRIDMTNANENREDVPSYLNLPPRGQMRPPVEVRAHHLPLGELTWEDFERLCLRLAKLQGDVLHCQLYGTRGQKQEGIDLYSRIQSPESYRVYQCKRETNFGAAKIRRAVEKFLSGEWAAKSSSFVLCTKESLVETSRADEIETQRVILKARGIEIIPWDLDAISLLLKDHPRLVDDFFGRSWVGAFLGREVSESLGSRLDLAEVSRFRQKLGELYRRVFDAHDPGLKIPAASPVRSLPLNSRYIIPDIIESRTGIREPDPFQPEEPNDYTDVWIDEFEPGMKDSSASVYRLPVEAMSERVPLQHWLGDGANFLVLGGPGTGKSSLLRYLAIDLLGQDPLLDTVASKWGEHLAVWVSFPYWTRLIEGEGQDVCSLSKFLRLWLRSLDEERLWPLVERALDDDRLLLLVDGLDEWSGEGAARIAIQRLQVFVEQRSVPSVAASRPHGIDRLGVHPPGWKVGRLAPLDRGQQSKLAMAWFLFRESGQSQLDQAAPDERRRAEGESTLLLSDLGRSRDLMPLAQNPLLLTLLIYHRFQNARLPRSRFRAYGSLIEHLMEIHPDRRRAAAQDNTQGLELSVDELLQLFAKLAYRIHCDSGGGIIPLEEAEQIAEEHLRDPEHGLGMDAASGRKLAKKVVDIGESNLGILVRQSPLDVGFIHRTFQEYLAARHLSQLSPDLQETEIDRYARDPRWREVILALLQATTQQHFVQKIIEKLRDAKEIAIGPERLYLESLVSEAAFGDFNCPTRLARELAVEAFEIVETGTRMVHRMELLGHALSGMLSTKVRDQVKERVRRWFPNRMRWRSSVYEAMERCPGVPEVVNYLWLGMHDEEPSNQLAAGRTLSVIGRGDDELGGRIERLAWRSKNPRVRAVAIDTLVRGWPDRATNEALIEHAYGSGSPLLEFLAISARVRMGVRNTVDRDKVLELADQRSGIHSTWRDEVAQILLDGWRGDQHVKLVCLDSLEGRNLGFLIESDVAWKTLISGFPHDSDVIELLSRTLDEGHHPGFFFLRGNSWKLLAENFRDEPRLVLAIDRWLQRGSYLENDLAPAVMVGRTPVGKAKLLASLRTSSVPFWALHALIDGWGRDDDDVRESISWALDLPPAKAGAVAHFFPDFIEDEAECRSRLFAIFRDPKAHRLDLALAGLRKISGTHLDLDALDLFVDEDGLLRQNYGYLDSLEIAYHFIGFGPVDPRIRRLALRRLSGEDPPYTAILRGFGSDVELRNAVLDRLRPLPNELRFGVVSRLAQDSPDASFSQELLRQYRDEEDSEVKSQASISYWWHVAQQNAASAEMIAQLRNDVACYGPDHDEQRQASFCGLLTLGRLDVMADAMETIGDPRPASITLAGKYHQGPNRPLARLVAENWETIIEAFGDDALVRLSNRVADPLGIWEYLAPVADVFPALRDRLISFLESTPSRKVPLSILQFLGRSRPKSIILKEYCLDALQIGRDDRDAHDGIAAFAAELLGRDHAGDEALLKSILSGRAKDSPYTKTVLCLIEGWPDHPMLDLVFRHRDYAPRFLGILAWHRLLCLKGLSDEVAEELYRLCRTPAPEFLRRDWTPKPFIERLQRDDILGRRLFDRLQGQATRSERTSLPRLIGAGRGLNEELRAWCYQELARQESLVFPEIGHDIFVGEEKSVSESLLDVLTSGENFGSLTPFVIS